ncbi:hypothetical protein AMTR_s00060p00158240 [Amborella trichopoda]|uniref:Uncharacterized protein n=1 Tax=Amborella trichopoda TaxID=13333 RepID=W1NK48_AMBTC|nr:hypothetical protein AMTR_s00060p00158240 [Amborella trichopoda]
MELFGFLLLSDNNRKYKASACEISVNFATSSFPAPQAKPGTIPAVTTNHHVSNPENGPPRLINYNRILTVSNVANWTLPRRQVFLGPAFDAEVLRSYSCLPDFVPGNDVHRQISPVIGIRNQKVSLSPVTPWRPMPPPPSCGKGNEIEEGVLVIDGEYAYEAAEQVVVDGVGVKLLRRMGNGDSV